MSAAKAPLARKKRVPSLAGAGSRKQDITRVLIRALKHENHPQLAQKLMDRSGLQGGSAKFLEFEQAFTDGAANVFELAEGLEFRSKVDRTYALALINTDRILKMIHAGNKVEAAALLREIDLAKVAPHLTSECTMALMAESAPEHSSFSRLQMIQQLLKPSVVVPLYHLAKLLADAKKYDVDQGMHLLQGVQIATVIVQALDTLGYKDLAAEAGEAMGVQLVAPAASSLQKALAAARWSEALKLLEAPRLFATKQDLQSAQQAVLLAAITDRVRVGRTADAVKLARLPLAHSCAPQVGEALLGGRALVAGRDLWDQVCSLLSPEMVVRPTLITDIIEMALRYQAMCDRFWAGPIKSLDTACIFTPVSAGINDNFPSKCMLQLSQESEVWSLAYRPKIAGQPGSVLASGNRDGQVTFYDTSKAFAATSVAMHAGGVQSMQWSPNGQYLASGCVDSTISVWDFTAGVRKVYVRCHTEGVGALCWLADGKHIASAGLDGTFAVWNMQGRVVWRHDQMRIISMVLVGDELHALSVGRQPRGQFIYRLDVKNWKYIDSIKVKGNEITSMAYSEQSGDLLFNEKPDRLVLVDLKGEGPARFRKGPKQSEFMIRSSFGGPFDKFVASGSEDGHVYVFNRLTGRQAHRMSGHNGTVNVAVWDPEKSLIASAGDDCTVRIWAPKDNLSL